MPEELSEGEKGATANEFSPKGISTKGGMKIINSVDVLKHFATQQKEKKPYIVLIRHVFSYHVALLGLKATMETESDYVTTAAAYTRTTKS
ncbi:hypothetical protein L1987_23902 [Smallanthus sonchifolius]|uniref:Uncharacterized protein n=1 Tax=Smallanthus sonchifolius TaxID=185202 RepID=A0ACB9IK94_9ASTR|nr:hypothetical protein L1987_23902 [Smallanthus sonchifolius]